MRLSQFEIDAIKITTKNIFGENSQVLLFGSRVDETKRGGDIDLYIISLLKDNFFQHKIKFLVELEKLIGEQKIDVIIAKDSSRPIEQVALRDGIKL